jgi:nicotinate-nucleotide adenylyltransferase
MIFRHDLPRAVPGQVVGLLGGSFDPPHRGHVHVTQEAIKRLRLDQVWWLVSPGNPLKRLGPAPLERRLAASDALVRHPRVEVTDIEARIGTRYTAETLRALRRRHPGVRFVWLMGADNLATLHHWDDWVSIMEMIPVGVLARPDMGLRAGLSPAARRFARARLPEAASRLLPFATPPAWCFVRMPMLDLSSSAIRARGDWPAF